MSSTFYSVMIVRHLWADRKHATLRLGVRFIDLFSKHYDRALWFSTGQLVARNKSEVRSSEPFINPASASDSSSNNEWLPTSGTRKACFYVIYFVQLPFSKDCLHFTFSVTHGVVAQCLELNYAMGKRHVFNISGGRRNAHPPTYSLPVFVHKFASFESVFSYNAHTGCRLQTFSLIL